MIASALLVLAVSGAAESRVPLAAGASHTIDFQTRPNAAYVVSLAERGVDCDVQLVNGSESHRGFDGDVLRYGVHRIAFIARATSVRLTARGSRPGSPAGEIEWRLELLPESDRGQELLETDVGSRYLDPARARSPETVDLARRLLVARQRGDDTAFVRASQLLDRVLAGAGLRNEAIEVLQAAIPVMQRLSDRRAEIGAHNNIAMHWFRMGDGRFAEEPLLSAIALLRGFDDVLLRAVVENNWCLTTASRGAAAEAVACYERAMASSLESADSMRIATAHNNLGHALSAANEHERAARQFEQAIALRTAIGDAAGTGDPLGNLGLERQAQQRYDDAEALFVRAETVYRESSNADGVSIALRHRGQLRLLLGDAPGAVKFLTQSVELDRASGRRRDLITALNRLGEAQALIAPGRIPAAIEEAVTLAEIDAEPRTLADALVRLARSANGSGDVEVAARIASRAGGIADGIGDPWLGGLARLESARVSLRTGSPATALQQAEHAFDLLTRAAHALGAADARGTVGMALVAQGHFDEGIAALADATDKLEAARSSLASPEYRARFFAIRRAVHEAHVLAMLDAARSPDRSDLLRQALAVSDAHRSRVLLDHIAPERTLAQALPEWPADVGLLHFLVTPQRSAVFVQVDEQVQAIALPGRAELEAQVQAFRTALVAGGSNSSICATLWERIAAVVELPKRVAVVADGPLLALPWAALPCGRDAGGMLVDSHEFVTLPSLAAWRVGSFPARMDTTSPTLDTLVVVDPVYGTDDARMGGRDIASRPVERLAMRGASFERLPGAQAEADLIARLHGRHGLEVMSGFEATREDVLAQLPTVRSTIHFGTHGIAGANALGEAGLVLTLLDRDGRSRDGFVSASTIAGLRMKAGLVVLAACESAEGVVVTGESALGVSYAFSLAGARQVMGALWPVSDGATSALMQSFYTGLYERKLSPSAALRHAQLEIRATRRYRDARHWAAFQLSGDLGG